MILQLYEQRTIVPCVRQKEQVVAYSGENSPFLSDFLDLLIYSMKQMWEVAGKFYI